jgi:hypothetical protein
MKRRDWGGEEGKRGQWREWEKGIGDREGKENERQ